MYVASRFLLPGAWRHTAVAGLDRTRSPPRYYVYGTGCGGGVLLAALVGLGHQAGEPEGRLLLLGGLRLLVRATNCDDGRAGALASLGLAAPPR